MHSYYMFLALDVAQERSREAEQRYNLRQAGGLRGSRLAGVARRARSFVFGRSLDLPGTTPTPAGSRTAEPRPRRPSRDKSQLSDAR
jgi:hypothetical protein